MITSNPTFIASFSEHMKEAGFTAEQTADKLYKLSLIERYRKEPGFREDVIKRARALRGDVGELLVRHVFEKSGNFWGNVAKGVMSAVPAVAAGYGVNRVGLVSDGSDSPFMGAATGAGTGAAVGGVLGTLGKNPRGGLGAVAGGVLGGLSGMWGRTNHHYDRGQPKTLAAANRQVNNWAELNSMVDRHKQTMTELPGYMRQAKMEAASLKPAIERLQANIEKATNPTSKFNMQSRLLQMQQRLDQLKRDYETGVGSLTARREQIGALQQRSISKLNALANSMGLAQSRARAEMNERMKNRLDRLSDPYFGGFLERHFGSDKKLNAAESRALEFERIQDMLRSTGENLKADRFQDIPQFFDDPAQPSAAQKGSGFLDWMKSLFSGGNA